MKGMAKSTFISAYASTTSSSLIENGTMCGFWQLSISDKSWLYETCEREAQATYSTPPNCTRGPNKRRVTINSQKLINVGGQISVGG